MELTESERKLLGFALACYIEDAERQQKKLHLGVDTDYARQLAAVQRITYTKVIPEALCGDDILADGTILRRP